MRCFSFIVQIFARYARSENERQGAAFREGGRERGRERSEGRSVSLSLSLSSAAVLAGKLHAATTISARRDPAEEPAAAKATIFDPRRDKGRVGAGLDRARIMCAPVVRGPAGARSGPARERGI